MKDDPLDRYTTTEADLKRVPNVDALEIIFREAYKNPNSKLLDVSIRTIWHMWFTLHKYAIDNLTMKGWFSQWYKRHKRTGDQSHDALTFGQQLLFPAYWFDEAHTFLWASKIMIYKTMGQVEEIRPTKVSSGLIDRKVLGK